MKILFIENRHKTFFYEPIAKRLLTKGNQIYWVIQNKEFIPGGHFKKYIIPYPKGNFQFKKDEEVEDIIKIDRQINHFRKNDSSYFYYYNEKIKDILNEVQPDIVFGESTAFHELLTILNCKKQNILYLNPTTCRYPVGRFSFYEYDSIVPYHGSKDILNKEESETIINQIVYRTVAPDYMKSKAPSKRIKLSDKITKIKSYFLGEKYNTPDPLIKFKLEKEKKKLISIWNQNSVMNLDGVNEFALLYPLQMQPESNLDVWGREYRDQKKLIKMMSEVLPKDCKLIVKPNPKSNYELSKELISFVKENEDIVILHHNVKMDDVLPKVDLVITVTGTIAIECALSNKPVVTLVKTINNKIKSCIYINNLDDELNTIITKVKKGDFPRINEEEKIEFINNLNQSSYRGKISDPFTDALCITEENINNLTEAFCSVIKSYDGKS